MRLYLISDNPKKDKWIDISFWSFFKCQFLAALAYTGIVYGIFGIIILIMSILGY